MMPRVGELCNLCFLYEMQWSFQSIIIYIPTLPTFLFQIETQAYVNDRRQV